MGATLPSKAIAQSQQATLNTINHSAGNFAVDEMNRKLEEAGRTDAAIGTQTMFGSPVNAQDEANRVNTITNGKGTVQQVTHQNDFVSTWFSWSPTQGASNPATPTSDGSMGNSDVGGIKSHSAYTGDLTTSTSAEAQIAGREYFYSPAAIRKISKDVWGDASYSEPKVLQPQQNAR